MNSFVLLLSLSLMMESVIAQPIALKSSPVFQAISEPFKKALSDIPNPGGIFNPHLFLGNLINNDLLSQLIIPFNMFLGLLQQQKLIAPILWTYSILEPFLTFLPAEKAKSILNPMEAFESAEMQKLANFQQSLTQFLANPTIFQPILSKLEEFNSKISNVANNNFKDFLV